MKTISEYRENIATLMSKMAAIDAKSISENRDPNQEELTLKNEMMDSIKEFQGIVETMERQERISAELNSPTGRPATNPAPQKSSGTTNSGTRVEFPTDSRSGDRFNSFGEQLTAIMVSSKPGGHTDPRLYNATGLGETVSSEGGFLVQQDYSTELLQEVFQTGILAQRCRRIQISGNSNGIKLNGVDETSRASSLWGGIQVYQRDEAALATASKPKFREIDLKLHKTIGVCYLTEELMADAQALEGWVRQGFTSAFGFKVDDHIFQGTGAGQALGLMNAGSLVTVSKEGGQKAATLLAENVINMYSRIFASSRQNAVWLINQNVEPQLFTLSLSVGTGGIPVYMPAGGLSGQPYGTLFGIPVLPIEQCASLGTTGDIVLADFKNGYILAEKGGMRSESSIHVQFLYDEQVLKFVLRYDGQPVRSTALTPYKGGSSYTQSHFIALETRA